MTDRRPMDVARLAEGLWTWRVPDVGRCSTYWEAGTAVVLIDPCLPDDAADRERFWRALDRDVARLRRPVAVLLTEVTRGRDALPVVDRYPGSTVAGPGAADPSVPGVVAVEVPGATGRVVYRLEGVTAVVAGSHADLAAVGGPGDARHVVVGRIDRAAGDVPPR